jgi:hypothetical protein
MFTITNFVSKQRAEIFWEPSGQDTRVLISMTTPAIPDTVSWNCSPAKLHDDTWKAVLRLEYDDRDPGLMNAADVKHYRLFNEDDAVKILKFLKQHQDDTLHAICHCEAGISRSAAVAKFIARIYNLDFPPSYDVYNRHVFSTLLRVYGTSLYGEGPLAVEDLPGLKGESK